MSFKKSKGQFHQHFMRSFFVLTFQVSTFLHKNIGAKAALKCWWNWHRGPISATFFECNCAIFFVPIKSLTFTSSTKKLCAKLLYEKAALKMLVKLTPGGICPPGVTIPSTMNPRRCWKSSFHFVNSLHRSKIFFSHKTLKIDKDKGRWVLDFLWEGLPWLN